jgi:hypothetical protein
MSLMPEGAGSPLNALELLKLMFPHATTASTPSAAIEGKQEEKGRIFERLCARLRELRTAGQEGRALLRTGTLHVACRPLGSPILRRKGHKKAGESPPRSTVGLTAVSCLRRRVRLT